MDDDLLTALYHAASSEEPDRLDGPSLCDYYRAGMRQNTPAAPWWTLWATLWTWTATGCLWSARAL